MVLSFIRIISGRHSCHIMEFRFESQNDRWLFSLFASRRAVFQDVHGSVARNWDDAYVPLVSIGGCQQRDAGAPRPGLLGVRQESLPQRQRGCLQRRCEFDNVALAYHTGVPHGIPLQLCEHTHAHLKMEPVMAKKDQRNGPVHAIAVSFDIDHTPRTDLAAHRSK